MKYTLIALIALTSLSSSLAHADAITASVAIDFHKVTVTAVTTPIPAGVTRGSLDPIRFISSISFSKAETDGDGTGNLINLLDSTTASGSTSLNPNATSGFTLTFGTFGTFTETGISLINESTIGHSSNVELYMLGIFTPGTSLGTFVAGPASLDLAFTDTNGTYSGSGTLASPPSINATPEPSSLMLLGSGLASAAGLVFRRRRNA